MLCFVIFDVMTGKDFQEMTSNVRSQMRNSNIELLRIIAMLIIVIHHFGNLGVFHLTDPSRNLLYAGNLSYQIIGTQLVCWGGVY